MPKERLPWVALLAFTTLAFSAIITELLPAGVLFEMAKDLHVPASRIGQLVSYFAIGTVLTAMPAAALTRNMSRKPLLLFVTFGFVISNGITALSHDYLLTVTVRITAGGFSGLLWPLLAGYTSKLVSKKNTGKAIAVVMAGSTLALSIGLPVGSFFGQLLGWRATFGALSVLSILLIAWIAWKVPDRAGDGKNEGASLSELLKMPGVALVLSTTFMASLSVYVSYTYLSPILISKGITESVSYALLLFGIGAVVGIFITGKLIDGYLRMTLLAAVVLQGISMFVIGMAGHIPQVLYISTILWGISFGGLPSLLQTATINAAKGSPEVGSSMTVTVYNIGVFSGSFMGGLILDFASAGTLTWTSQALIIIVIFSVIIGRKSAFPTSAFDRKNL